MAETMHGSFPLPSTWRAFEPLDRYDSNSTLARALVVPFFHQLRRDDPHLLPVVVVVAAVILGGHHFFRLLLSRSTIVRSLFPDNTMSLPDNNKRLLHKKQ